MTDKAENGRCTEFIILILFTDNVRGRITNKTLADMYFYAVKRRKLIVFWAHKQPL